MEFKAHLLRLLLQVGDQIVPVLGLLQSTKRHLGARDVLLGVLEVLELSGCQPKLILQPYDRVTAHTKVPSSHTMAFCLFASV